MALPQLPLQRHLTNVYGNSNHSQQPIHPPPWRPSPPVRPPAPPPIQRSPLQAQPPQQLRPTPPIGIPPPSTAQKRKYEPTTAVDRDYPARGPDERDAQRQAQPAPLPFYPRLDRNEEVPQQVLRSAGSILYGQRPRSNALLTGGNTIGVPRGILQHSRPRTGANSVEVLPRQTRRGAFIRRQVQRRAEMERLAAERIERDMGDGASDEERYWKGGVQNLEGKYEEPDMPGLAQIEKNLRASCERVWKWIDKVPDDEECLERNLVLEGYEWE